MSLSDYVRKHAQKAISGDTSLPIGERIRRFMHPQKFYVIEPKIDGVRVFLISTADKVVLSTKHNGVYGAADFPQLFKELEVKPNSVLDCELVKPTQTLHIFDLLWFDGKDFTSEPLELRKQKIKEAVSLDGREHVKELNWSVTRSAEQADEEYQTFTVQGFEGAMLKDAYAPYGSSGAWLKLKMTGTFDCVILRGRPTKTTAAEGYFVSWELGLYDYSKDPPLVYVGDSNTYTIGFDPREARVGDVVEVRHQPTENFKDLRNAVILRTRKDKLPAECTIEQLS